MRIYHIAQESDWVEARGSGTYTTSTLGRSLVEEGFIHASRREQVPTTFQRFYRGQRGPFVLLTIETKRLSSPWREDSVGDETFPHIYGPLNVDAVVAAESLSRQGAVRSTFAVAAAESFQRMAWAMLAMVCSLLGMVVGASLDPRWGQLVGAVVGLAVGIAAALLARRVLSLRAGR